MSQVLEFDDQSTGTPWTRDELTAAFELVENPNYWKDPIKSSVVPSKREVVREAIIFFTGTVPTFTEVVDPDTGQQTFEVEAVGYLHGPCGP